MSELNSVTDDFSRLGLLKEDNSSMICEKHPCGARRSIAVSNDSDEEPTVDPDDSRDMILEFLRDLPKVNKTDEYTVGIDLDEEDGAASLEDAGLINHMKQRREELKKQQEKEAKSPDADEIRTTLAVVPVKLSEMSQKYEKIIADLIDLNCKINKPHSDQLKATIVTVREFEVQFNKLRTKVFSMLGMLERFI